jgi:hypothetical protein
MTNHFLNLVLNQLEAARRHDGAYSYSVQRYSYSVQRYSYSYSYSNGA